MNFSLCEYLPNSLREFSNAETFESTVDGACSFSKHLISSFHISEPSRGPSIDSITEVTDTSMKIIWEKLNNDDANGVITMYDVCYKASDTSTDIDCNLKKSVNNGDTREVVLDSLNEATTYNVAVKAKTSQGFGDLGTIITKKTPEASEYVFLPNYHSVELLLVFTRTRGEG